MVSDLMKILRLMLFLPLMLALAGASGTALADPPARVGRLSVVEGEVALRRDGSRDWVRAGVNLPITTGDELATQPDARAEVRIGSSVLRLDQATSVEVRRLDEERIRVRLKEGSVAMRIRSGDREDAIEVETRDGIAQPAEPGQYRVDFLGSATLVSNHRGHIDFRTADRQIAVTEGRRAQLWSDGPDEVQWDDPDQDDFIAWSFGRDDRDDRVARNRYVSPEMTGAEDLYEYGDWREYDDYGPVWFPRSMPYGWAPYRYGHWVSVAPWGWTWVDDAPWGFAPFHYGRWVRIRGSWAWVPGRYIARPIYAPALVAWIGSPGVSISYSSGMPNVGWFPLAPREVFVPQYRYSPTYVHRVNITQVTNIIEIDRVVKTPQQVRYAFRDRGDAVTRVSERILRPPTPVTLDVENRREHRLREWERRGFPVREVVRQDGTRVRAVQPAEVLQQRGNRDERMQAIREQRQDDPQRVDPRQGRFAEGMRQLREREQQQQQQPQQQDPQRQRPFLSDPQDGRRDQIRQERLEALRQQQNQNVRDRDEQARRDAAAQQDEQQRQRSSLRDRLEQRREEASRGQREEVDQRRDERQQRFDAQRQQIEQQRAERDRQQAVQAQEQERSRRDALRQQMEQREREAQVQQQRQQEAGEREARRQQFEQQRAERDRQQAVQAQEQERSRRDGLRQQMEQREREAQVQQQRQIQIQQQQQQQQQQQAEQQRNQMERLRERVQQREVQQQDNRRGGEEEQQQRRRRPFGQDGERQ